MKNFTYMYLFYQVHIVSSVLVISMEILETDSSVQVNCCSANCKLAQLAAHSSLLRSIQSVTAMGTIQHVITPMETVFVAILEYLDQGVHSEWAFMNSLMWIMYKIVCNSCWTGKSCQAPVWPQQPCSKSSQIYSKGSQLTLLTRLRPGSKCHIYDSKRMGTL